MFTNTYTEPDPTSTQLEVKKLYQTEDGQSVNFGENVFKFKIEAENNAPLPAVKEIETSGSDISEQNLVFGSMEYTEDVGSSGKTYVYRISEVIPTVGEEGFNPSVTYDDSVIMAEVKVIKDENNDLVVESITYKNAAGEEIQSPDITNIYTEPDPTSTQLEVNKLYQTEDGQSVSFGENVFKFKIEAEDNAPLPAVKEISTSGSDISQQDLKFGSMEYTEDVGSSGKTYVYRISEVIPTVGEEGFNPSVTYDNSVITAEVKVIKDENNDLVVESITYKNAEGETLQSPDITNIYTTPDPISVSLEATKIYTGNELKGGDFSFELRDSEGEVIDTVTNDKDGNIVFTPIDYTEDVGSAGKDYSYTISEVEDGNPSITYDNKVVNVTVRVEKNTENKLVATVTYDGSQTTVPNFENTYTAPTPVAAELTANKKFIGNKLKGGDFTFVLKDSEGNVLQTVQNDRFGNIAFDSLIFEEYLEDKIYTYTISEIDDGQESVSYDDKIITVKVNVTRNDENHLEADVTYETEKGESENPEFVNIYTEQPKTGDQSDVALYMMLMALSGSTFIAARRKRKEK